MPLAYKHKHPASGVAIIKIRDQRRGSISIKQEENQLER